MFYKTHTCFVVHSLPRFSSAKSCSIAFTFFCPTLAGSFMRWDRRLTPDDLMSGNLMPVQLSRLGGYNKRTVTHDDNKEKFKYLKSLAIHFHLLPLYNISAKLLSGLLTAVSSLATLVCWIFFFVVLVILRASVSALISFWRSWVFFSLSFLRASILRSSFISCCSSSIWSAKQECS